MPHGSDGKGDYWRLRGELLNTGCSSQSQWLHSRNAVAHLHNCVYPHNGCITLKSFWYAQPASTTATELSSFLKILLQGARKRRPEPVLMATLIPLLNTLHNRMWACVITQAVCCCLPAGNGIQIITDQKLEWSQRTTGKGSKTSPSYSYPTPLASCSSPSVLSLLTTSATTSNVPISILASFRWLDHLQIPLYPATVLILATKPL